MDSRRTCIDYQLENIRTSIAILRKVKALEETKPIIEEYLQWE